MPSAPVDDTRELSDATDTRAARSPRLLVRNGEDLRGIGASPIARAAIALLALAANIGFYLPSVPDVPAPPSLGLDKLVHVGVFALTVWAIGRLCAPVRRFPMGWVVLAALAHALAIEVLQGALMPERSADVADVLADSLGIAAGVLAWHLERRWIRAGSPRPGWRGSPR